jgi:type VI secretion system protein ImpJ
LRSPQRVVWTEGMFMTPHHFQQLDLYHEALVDTRLRGLAPHPWGVVSIEFDLEALRAGQIQLMRFFGMLPDGLPLSFERGQPEAPAARLVEGHFQPARPVLDVYLGVPKERSNVESYGSNERPGSNPRFAPAKRPVSDLQSATSIIPMEFARPNAALLFGTEPRDDFEAIKIAELSRDATGALVLVDGYVPPCLRVDASPYVMSELRKLLRVMVSKQRQLATRRKHRDESSLEFAASDVTMFLELAALNVLIPFLQHAQEAGDLPPRDVYLALSRCAGQLCTFTTGVDPAALPSFQLTNLRATFQELFEVLDKELRSIAREQCIQVAMQPGQDRVYRGSLEDERLTRCNQFLIKLICPDMPRKTAAEQLPKLAKAASGSEINGLVQAAAPGVPIQVTYQPPPEVPIQSDAVYFELATHDGYWKNAMRERSLAVYLPQPFEINRTTVELLAVPTMSR